VVLGDDEKKRIEPMLLPVCRTAIKGIVLVVEYYKSHLPIVEPEILRKYRYVYVEDSPVN
jgi:hypothetical protein